MRPRALLEAGASKDMKTTGGETALDIAKRNGHYASARSKICSVQFSVPVLARRFSHKYEARRHPYLDEYDEGVMENLRDIIYTFPDGHAHVPPAGPPSQPAIENY